MRLIGHVTDEKDAQTFADFLYVHGIQNTIEHEKDTGYGIWISEEDEIPRATAMLEEFKTSPKDDKYREHSKTATDKRQHAEKDQEQYRKRLKDRRHLFRPITPYGFGPVTFVLIVGSLAVFAWSAFGSDYQPIRDFFITGFAHDKTLPEIRHGQIWRLITPILIHGGWLHIIFNMLWLRDLGSMVEARQSSLYLFFLTLIIAALSNVAQFYLGGVPNFGGMSGVVYGLLGYIWLRGKFDPASGLYLHSSTVIMMLIWFAICFIPGSIPGVGRIANMAHAAGLAAGMLWGYVSSLRYR